MTEESEIAGATPAAEPLDSEYIARIRSALAAQSGSEVRSLLADLHPSDVAELFGLIDEPEREALVKALADDFDGEILTYLDEEIRSEIIGYLGTKKTAEAIVELETDDAVQIMEDLEDKEKQELLDAIPLDTRIELEEGLAYPEQSAGRLMNTRFAAVPEFWTVGDVIDYLRAELDKDELPEDFYEIIVVDPRYHPVGSVKVSRVMQSQRNVPVRDLMKQELQTIPVAMDQEEAAVLFRRYGLVEVPVVHVSGRMLGVLTIDDMVHVIAEEQEEDYLRAGGVLDRGGMHAGLFDTVKLRLPWLLVNLVTANMAALVIRQFEGIIEQWVTLAVLMPMIASMSGNAGIQSVTVAVRAIAARELKSENAWKVIRKEMLTNFCNGIILSMLMGLVILLVYKDGQLAGIFSAATIGMLALAGFVGAMIPLILSRLKIDPAIASGVFLTMLTDMLSFFSFLGLAAWLVL